MKPLSFVALLVATTALVSAVQVHAQTRISGQALPQKAQLVSGAATVSQDSATQTTITQTSQSAILNWQSFSIAQGNTVNVLQPGATSVLLNRVTGTQTSTIAGQLNANGQVFLINPNGIVIDKTGSVQAAGFVASTMDISDDDFRSGKLNFKAVGAGASLVHAGTIRIAPGGYAALLGGSVTDTGQIIAPMGKVAIGAGTQATLDLSGDGFLQVALSDAAVDQAGLAVLSATDARNAVRQTVNTDGVDAATSVSGQDGHVILSGRIDTSSAGGAGANVKVLGTTLDLSGGAIDAGNARVETSGDTVNFSGIKVSAGNWLVDPVNLTVDSAAAATISSNLATTDITLQTTASGASGTGVQSSGAGDIIVNAAINWGSSHQLTLNAYHNISINAPIIVAGNGKVNFVTGAGGDYDFGLGTNGFTGSLTFMGTPNSGQDLIINGQDYTLVYSMAQLDAIDGMSAITGATGTVYGAGFGGNYALAKPLDASGTTYNQSVIGGANAVAGTFDGTLEGLGNSISHLTIYDPGDSEVGLIALTGDNTTAHTPATIRDISMFNESVTGRVLVAGLVGAGTNYTDGTIGLIIKNAVVQANVSAGSTTVAGDPNGPYSDAGIVVGDVLGAAFSNIVTSGTVNAAATDAGGIAGFFGYGTLSQSSSSAVISAGNSAFVGGLVGEAYTGSNINNSFATGGVTGYRQVGGLVGFAESGSSISSSYSTGGVTGLSGTAIGGLVGQNKGSIISSYWDTQTSGQASSAGGTGLTTAQLQSTLPSGFDPSIWGTGPGLYPYLKWAYSSGGQTIFGYTETSSGGVAVGAALYLYRNGVQLNADPIYSGANGYYYYLVPANTVVYKTPIGTTMTLAGATGISGIAFDDTPTLIGNTVDNGMVQAGRLHGWVSQPTWSSLLAEMSTTFGASRFASLETTSAFGHTDIYALLPTFTLDVAQDVTNVFKVTEQYKTGTLIDAAPIVGEPGSTVSLISNGVLTIDAPITIKGNGIADLRYDTYQSQHGVTLDPSAFSFGAGDNLTYLTASGAAATTSQGGVLDINTIPYTLVYSMAQLDAIDGVNALTGVSEAVYGPGLAGNYALAAPLDASGTTYTQSIIGLKSGGDVGNLNYPSANLFSGILEGLGNSISNLAISDTGNSQVALVSRTAYNFTTQTPATLRDLNMLNETVTGWVSVGGLVGSNNGSDNAASVSPPPSGKPALLLENDNVQANVTAIGSYSSAPFSPDAEAGGAIGNVVYGMIQNVVTSGIVTGTGSHAGGIVGYLSNGIISGSTSTAKVVTTGLYAGGLIGLADNGTSVVNSYATGPVSGGSDVGGLVGLIQSGSSITDAYSTGRVVATASGGTAAGLSVVSGGTITNSYWDTQTSGLTTSGGGTGLTTAQLQGTLPTGFDASIWGTGAGLYPYLKWQYPNGAEAIIGVAEQANLSIAAVAGLTFYKDGAQLNGSPIYSGANGYYYLAVPAGTVVYKTPIGTTMTLAGQAGISGIAFVDTPTLSGYSDNNGMVQAGRLHGWVSQPTWSSLVAEMSSTFGAGRFTSLETTADFGHTDIYALLPTFTVDVAQDVTSVFKVTEQYPTGTLIDAAPIVGEPGSTVSLISNGALAIDAPVTIKGNGVADLRYDTYPSQHGGTLDPSAFSFGAGDSVTYLTSAGAAATGSQGGVLDINTVPYNLIYTLPQFGAMDGAGLGGIYALANDLSGAGTTYSQSAIGGIFTGTLEGLGHNLSNLSISGNNATLYTGLFAYSKGTIRDLSLPNLSVTGATEYIGGLVAQNQGLIVNVSGSGTVTNNGGAGVTGDTGGLVGHNGGTVEDASFSGNVSANFADSDSSVGGLVGNNAGDTGVSAAFIIHSSSSGMVSGGYAVGGLVGVNNSGNNATYITGSYSTASVSGQGIEGGGLAGLNYGSIADSYATGAVNGTGTSWSMGGLVGFEGNGVGNITTSYATGLVSNPGRAPDGSLNTGGIMGSGGILVTNTYWDLQSTGQTTSAAGTGLTTAQMQSGTLPAGFDPAIWTATAGHYPTLRGVSGQ